MITIMMMITTRNDECIIAAMLNAIVTATVTITRIIT